MEAGMRTLMFPGQGSQAVGMCQDLYEMSPVVRETYEEASEMLGYNIAAVSFRGPPERLNRTDITQPALLTSSVAVLRLLRQRGLCYDAVFGHSLGEYSALVAAEALPFSAAVALVRHRGMAMQAAADESPGGMVAVLGLEDAAVEALCTGIEDAWPANFNSPGQVVVSGSRAGLERVSEGAILAGARKVVPLAVSGAFHSPPMAAAARTLGPALRAAPWSTPVKSFFSACSARPEGGPFAELLERQLTAPVRFTQTVRHLVAGGCDEFLEVGPGAVLYGLVRRIEPRVTVARAGDVASVDGLDSGWFA